MAHEVETMAYAGEVPWHGLGVPVINDLTPEQMMEKAKVNWTVEKYPLYIDIGKKKIFSENQALVRSSDNSILSVISDDWTPVQNSTAFEFFHEFVMAGDMEMHTAGSLKKGKVVWALAKIKESFDLFGGDKVDSYLLFSNPHEYGKSLNVRFTPIRVVCNNTLTLALGTKSEKAFSMNHRRIFNPEEVKTTLGLAKSSFQTYKQSAEFLGSKRYTKDSVKQYFMDVFPASGKKQENEEMSRPAETAYAGLETQPGNNFAPGSWWQAFNASTYAVDHILGRSVDTRLTSAWYGPNQQRKVNALRKAIEYAEAA